METRKIKTSQINFERFITNKPWQGYFNYIFSLRLHYSFLKVKNNGSD